MVLPLRKANFALATPALYTSGGSQDLWLALWNDTCAYRDLYLMLRMRARKQHAEGGYIVVVKQEFII